MSAQGEGVFENLGGALRILWALATPFLRSRRVRWGATAAELARRFAGDELVPTPRWQYLHAVDIDAPPAQVWPWIAQIGQGRGGFYSYALLENLVGCGIRNADRVLPEFQSIAVGDPIALHPKVPPLRVAVLEPGHALVLHGTDNLHTAKPPDPAESGSAGFLNVSWALVLEPRAGGGTRLFSRDRTDYRGGWAMALGYGPLLVEPISFAMDTKMLRGIKQRAEASATQRAIVR